MSSKTTDLDGKFPFQGDRMLPLPLGLFQFDFFFPLYSLRTLTIVWFKVLGN